MQVTVRDNNVDQALRALKKKLHREGVFQKFKEEQFFTSPGEKVREAKKRQWHVILQVPQKYMLKKIKCL